MRYIDGDSDSVQHIAVLEYEYLGTYCQAYASNGWIWIFFFFYVGAGCGGVVGAFKDMLLLVLHMYAKNAIQEFFQIDHDTYEVFYITSVAAAILNGGKHQLA